MICTFEVLAPACNDDWHVRWWSSRPCILTREKRCPLRSLPSTASSIHHLLHTTQSTVPPCQAKQEMSSAHVASAFRGCRLALNPSMMAPISTHSSLSRRNRLFHTNVHSEHHKEKPSAQPTERFRTTVCTQANMKRKNTTVHTNARSQTSISPSPSIHPLHPFQQGDRVPPSPTPYTEQTTRDLFPSRLTSSRKAKPPPHSSNGLDCSSQADQGPSAAKQSVSATVLKRSWNPCRSVSGWLSRVRAWVARTPSSAAAATSSVAS
ncbi:uncharacterized protein IWZ02DRAFT_73712 [Phyllosticta citriasiana]|uniref:uncharacterized protein n=1 Tax=Phyllosticta citriasiana TaxID=595635 RepID=UPI0030FDDF33